MNFDEIPDAEQVRVLVWIDEGCPEDRFTEGHMHKIRAQALASRGLATVSRRQRRWQAKITDRGRHFLAKGTIPPRQRTPRSKSSRRVPPTAAAPPAPSAARSTVGVERRKVNRPTSKVSKTELLIARVIAAGGDLHLDDDERGPHGVDAQVRTARRLSKTPPGTRLYAYGDIDGGHVRLIEVPGWTIAHDDPLAVPATTRTLSPALCRIKDAPIGRTGMTAAVLPRALRLLQALVNEGRARDHSVVAEKPPRRDGGRIQSDEDFHPQAILNVRGTHITLTVKQLRDRTEHEPTERELADRARYGWARVPDWDYTPSKSLSLQVASDYVRADTHYNDEPDGPLESRLQEAMFEVEVRAEITAIHDRINRQRQRIEEERRRQEAELKRLQELHAHRVETLSGQVAAWSSHRDAVAYADALRTHVDGLDGEQAAAAREWLAWIDEHLAAGPFAEDLTLPRELPRARHWNAYR